MIKSIRKYISFHQIGNEIHAKFYSRNNEFPGLMRTGKCKFSEKRWENVLPKLIKHKPLNKKWLDAEFNEYVEKPE